MLAWPETREVRIKSLADGSPFYTSAIKKVRLLGYGDIRFSRTAEGLIVKLPEKSKGSIAPVLRIENE